MARLHCIEAVPGCCSDGKKRVGWVRYQRLGWMTELKFLKEDKKEDVHSTMCMVFLPSEQVLLLHMCATFVIFLFLNNFESARSIYFLASLLQLWCQRTWHPEHFRKPQVFQKLFLWPWQWQEK